MSVEMAPSIKRYISALNVFSIPANCDVLASRWMCGSNALDLAPRGLGANAYQGLSLSDQVFLILIAELDQWRLDGDSLAFISPTRDFIERLERLGVRRGQAIPDALRCTIAECGLAA